MTARLVDSGVNRDLPLTSLRNLDSIDQLLVVAIQPPQCHPTMRRKDEVMKGLKFLLITLTLVALLLLSASYKPPVNAAQVSATPAGLDLTPTVNAPNPNVVITAPILVSELHGQVAVHGTANLDNMADYFLDTQ